MIIPLKQVLFLKNIPNKSISPNKNNYGGSVTIIYRIALCRRKANTTPKFTPKKKNPSLGTSVAKYPIKQEIIIEKTQADHYY